MRHAKSATQMVTRVLLDLTERGWRARSYSEFQPEQIGSQPMIARVIFTGICLVALGSVTLATGSACAAITSVVDIPLEGQTQRILYVRPDSPGATIATMIVLPGGTGIVGIQADGSMTTREGLCSPSIRTRTRFADQGIALAVVDATSNGEVLQLDALMSVFRYVQTQTSSPIWVNGTSGSTAAAGNLTVRLQSEALGVGGVIFASPTRPSPSVTAQITRPALVVFHSDDTNQFGNLMYNALTASTLRERVVFSGGTPGGCDGPHLFNGLDAEFTQAVSNFVRSAPQSAVTRSAFDYGDMWWSGTVENGWGMSITHHRPSDVLFVALYVYDSNGLPTWYTLPGGSWNITFDTYVGALYRPTSAPLDRYAAGAFNVGNPVGNATIRFTSESTAVMTYTINGLTAQKAVSRQVFGTADSTPVLRVRDMWWSGPDQNGWGVTIAQQERTLFAIWFTYGKQCSADSAGCLPTWIAMPGGTWGSGSTANQYSGDLYTTTSSPWLGVTYDPTAFTVTRVGDMTFSFVPDSPGSPSSVSSNATMTYRFTQGPFAGIAQTRSISRLPF